MACSTETAETGRFCPECGAVLARGAADGAAVTVHGSTGSNAAAASLIGLVVDGFAIEAVHGGGSFGTVYRGRQVGLDRVVAIKVPTHEIAADPIQARRFAREARAASRVIHPGVVAIHAVGELPDGRPYLAMQLVEGEPLDRILADGPVPALRALELARQIASALSETHAAEVVHRDLKPSNIVWRVDRNGDDRLVLVDFGIAVCKPGTADATRLTAGGLIGTPHYMSPEQAHGEICDARADLYALGCILFELLTGTTPFDGSGFEVLLAHLGRPAPLPSERTPDIPPAIDQLVADLMGKKPEQRPQSADALVIRIDEVLDELEGLRPPAAPRTTPAPVRAKRKSQSPTTRDKPAVVPRPATAPGASRVPIPRDEPTASHAWAAGSAPRPSLGLRIRYLAFGAAGALALTAATFTAVQLTSGHSAIVDDGGGGGSAQKRREIFRDDGETRLRVFVPDPMRIKKGGQRVFLELRNKLGARLEADQVIVTVEDPAAKVTGVIARPRQSDPTQYSFFYDYQAAGTYRIRIFPPETASFFEVELDVAP